MHRGEVGISDIARDLELTVGTVYRLVSTLTEAGFAEQNSENRKYRPGPKVLTLANEMRSNKDFLSVGHRSLERLMELTGETVNLGVRRGDKIVYVDRVVSNEPLAVEVKVGSQVPAYCTALGKAILANSDPSERDAYVVRLRNLAAADGLKPPTQKDFERELDNVKLLGIAIDRGEFSPDIACVAAPVIGDRGKAVAAVSVSGPRSRVEARVDDLIPLVEITGKELSTLLQEIGELSVRI